MVGDKVKDDVVLRSDEAWVKLMVGSRKAELVEIEKVPSWRWWYLHGDGST